MNTERKSVFPAQVDFPTTWMSPVNPSYGMFPWPFRQSHVDRQKEAQSSLEAILSALQVGYRHIDTAFAYSNQEQVGEAVNLLNIPRKDIFVTSKLHQNDNFYDNAVAKIQEAVSLIWGKGAPRSIAYLDAFLIHYPGVGDPSGTWKALQEARDKGLVHHIGVSNFEIWHLERLRKESGEYPEINQIEFHPWIYPNQAENLRFCQENRIAVEGYSPLAQAKCLQIPFLAEMAKKYQTTPARILLKWSMQHGVLPIIGSRNPEHILSNFEKYAFDLSEEEINFINRMGISNPILIAEQWNWNSKNASYGGPIPSRKKSLLSQRIINRIKMKLISTMTKNRNVSHDKKL